MMKNVLNLLDLKYGCTITEKIEKVVEDWMKFKEDQFEDDSELILAMKEINKRRKDLEMMDNEWVAV